MKYIIFENPDTIEFPVLFPELIGHDFIRDSINACYPGVKAVRAGFCNANGACWGKSVRLNLNSNMALDEFLLKQMFDKSE
jgi:hypothetical protein